MQTIRREGIRKSRRTRECYYCGQKIKKDEKYVFREVRYDNTILSLYYHNGIECAPKYLVK